MKISCIALNSNLIQIDEQSNIIKFIKSKLYEIGENISLISYFDNKLDKLKNIFNENYDLMFFIGTNDSIYNYNIKDNLSRIFSDKMSTNENCYSNLKKYCDLHNIPFSIREENEVMLPSKSIPLIYNEHYSNGFMYKFNNTYIAYLPSDIDFVKFNYEAYILPLLNDLLNTNNYYQVIKCFGILEKDIKSQISEYFNMNNFKINIVSDDLDSAIYIRYSSSENLQQSQEFISNIVTKLNKFIYSLEDVTIYEMASQLLSVQKKNISIGETLTSGNLTKELGLLDSTTIASTHIYFDYDSMINEFKIDKKLIDQFGKYSVNIVYELANALLEKESSDNVLFILAEKSTDYCYIAVGDIDGIHVYKNKIQLSNESNISNISKTATFYLIKKLKQNSLQFI